MQIGNIHIEKKAFKGAISTYIIYLTVSSLLENTKEPRSLFLKAVLIGSITFIAEVALYNYNLKRKRKKIDFASK